MSSRVPKRQELTRDRRVPTEVEFEVWCLMCAIQSGQWLQAGLNREVGLNGSVGYWKYLRDGALLVVEVEL